jgi:branched-chain amino acid transport system ATP-binding protein
MLEIHNLRVSYGAVNALKGVSLSVRPGEVVALIGANGAGKSTLLNTIAGVLKPSSGDVLLENQSIRGLAPEAIVRKGIALVPEGRRVFASLSVQENLRLGAIIRKDREEMAGDVEVMCERFPILGKRLHQAAGTLSGGEQQQLAIARALMSRPKLLMLDEPSLGLAPILVDEIFNMIKGLSETEVTILLVEQNVKRTLETAHRAYVLSTGRIEHEGSARDILASVDIASTYLGSGHG